MKYVLDTDILVYFIKGDKNVIERVSATSRSDLSTTIFNQTELLYGAFHSTKIESNLKVVQATMKDIRVLDFSHEASFIFAEHKAKLHKQGKILADMDLLIASIAMANHAILVTNNTKHFDRLKNLKLENWAK